MARRFEFRLETLLRVRRLREREALRRVAAKSAEIARLDALNAQTQQAIRDEQSAQRGVQEQRTFEAGALARGRAWVGYLHRAMLQRDAEKAQRQQELAVLHRELAQARTQTRSIEKLREKRFAEHRRLESVAAQAAAEELAQQMHERDREDA